MRLQAAAEGVDKAKPSKRKRAADSDDDLGSDSEDEFYDRTGAPSKKAATAAAGASGAGKKAAAAKGQPAAQVESAESLHAKRCVGVWQRGEVRKWGSDQRRGRGGGANSRPQVCW